MPLPFEPTCNGFSLRNAYYLAKASAAAYASGPAFDSAVAELGLKAFPATTVVNDISYFLGVADNFCVLAFRGTVASDIHNWLTDATIQQVPDRGGVGQVHRGFSDALTGEWSDILASVKRPEAAGKPLFVTGHSLGGGMATLAAQWLDANGAPVQGTYTYGSPRVGNPDFYKNYSPLNYRFVNNCDVVPHVPLPVGALGLQVLFYKHVGTLQYLDRHGNLNDGMSDWDTKKDFMINEVATVTKEWDACIADHAIARYIDAIGQNAPSNTPAS